LFFVPQGYSQAHYRSEPSPPDPVPLEPVVYHRDDVLLLSRTATPVQATRLGPLHESALGIVQTHMTSIIEGACLWTYRHSPAGKKQAKKNRKVIIYSADDVVKAYPRPGGSHQTDGLETAPFHRFVLLARDQVYPDGYWNVDTAPRRDETVRPAKEAVLHELQRGLAGKQSFSLDASLPVPRSSLSVSGNLFLLSHADDERLTCWFSKPPFYCILLLFFFFSKT
jgi:hypothetical protein